MARALIPLANGFEEVEALSIVDVLRRGGVEAVTASIHADCTVMGAHGVPVTADVLFSEVADEEFDALVLPGGGEGTENLKNSDAVIGAIRRQRDEGRLLAAICAAPTVLDEAGVLEENHQVTCYPTCQMDLSCPWVDEPVVEHDGIITSQAPGTAMLFALVVLQALAGENVARKVARGLVFEF